MKPRDSSHSTIGGFLIASLTRVTSVGGGGGGGEGGGEWGGECFECVVRLRELIFFNWHHDFLPDEKLRQ